MITFLQVIGAILLVCFLAPFFCAGAIYRTAKAAFEVGVELIEDHLL